MKIRIGYELEYECPKPTPMILTLNVHSSRMSDLVTPDRIMTDPPLLVSRFSGDFGNRCARLTAPAGKLRLISSAVISDCGIPDAVRPDVRQVPVELLPIDVLPFLRGSRYCETDRLSDIAWQLFGHTPEGWGRVQAICDHVHHHIAFGYAHARATRTAWEAHQERNGVCRDYAHLAIAFCRCMNIPARYCTGYLGDIGMPPPYDVMDFAGWFEAYLGDRWYTFDARNNMPRIGRILIARGRDAADVSISNAFGMAILTHFRVYTEELDVVQNESAACTAADS
jgi:transglutaminase-like putative cysteine protease